MRSRQTVKSNAMSMCRLLFEKACAIAAAALSLFFPLQSFAQSSIRPVPATSEQARRDTVVSVTVKTFVLGVGVDIMSRLDSQNAIGIAAEGDAYVVDASLFAGLVYQRFIGNSFFTRFGVGAADFSEFDSDRALPALDVVIGNEWILGGWLILGADWIGGSLVVTSSKDSSTSNFHWPKFRFGVTF